MAFSSGSKGTALVAVCAGALLLSAQSPTYHIVVVRGDNATNRVKKGRATSQAVVEVRDENNNPVAGVLLTFTLPTVGPGGVFTSGGAMTTAVTDAAGQATVSYTPNSLAGSFNLGVSAQVSGQPPVTANIAQNNIATAAAAGGISGAMIGVIVGVVAAGAVGGILATRSSGSSTPGGGSGTPPTVPAAIRIGVGGPITVGGR